jgi:hypothetical protein
LGYTSDTSRYMYLGRFLGVTLDTYQDTSGDVYLGLFITIHHDTSQDTYAGYIWDTFWNTHLLNVSREVRIWDSGYMRDTCEIHVSARVIKIHLGYIRNTWWDTCISNASRERCIWYEGDMRDTCKIHARYMYPQR